MKDAGGRREVAKENYGILERKDMILGSDPTFLSKYGVVNRHVCYECNNSFAEYIENINNFDLITSSHAEKKRSINPVCCNVKCVH